MNHVFALLSILVLTMPAQPEPRKSLMVGVCGDGDIRISIPFKPPLPGEDGNHGCCRKACHAANDRKRKANGTEEDNCC